MFQKLIFSTRACDYFWRDMGAKPVFFGLFYLKSYDDEIWYVGTLYDLEYECTNRISIFGRKPVLWAVNPFYGRKPRFSDFLVCSKTKGRIIFKFGI